MLSIALALAVLTGQTHAGSRQNAQYANVEVKSVEPRTGPAAEFDRFVRAHVGTFQGCYERELANDPLLAGTLIVELDLLVGGIASEARVSGSIKNSVLADCVKQAVKTWRFPFEPAKETPARIVLELSTASHRGAEFDDVIGETIPNPPPLPKVARHPVTVKTVELNGKADDALNRFVTARVRGFQSCYDRALEHAPKLRGSATIETTITTAGRSGEPTVTDDLKDETLSGCLKAVVKGWVYPFKPDASAPAKLVLLFGAG